jgi:serine protease inhibitor ecotin
MGWGFAYKSLDRIEEVVSSNFECPISCETFTAKKGI